MSATTLHTHHTPHTTHHTPHTTHHTPHTTHHTPHTTQPPALPPSCDSSETPAESAKTHILAGCLASSQGVSCQTSSEGVCGVFWRTVSASLMLCHQGTCQPRHNTHFVTSLQYPLSPPRQTTHTLAGCLPPKTPEPTSQPHQDTRER